MRPPIIVVAVLLATGGVDAGRLHMTARVGADPDVIPGGRDREIVDPLDHGRIVDPGTVVLVVAEAAAATDAA